MSDIKKPLIFLRPYSETLEKLKESMSENIEAEAYEIFEVDSLEELSQLIPTVGPSLTICASPKKTAMMLQNNARIIHKLSSKVILLSKKALNQKIMTKFMKLGLTECIVEPVAPKTLVYKVKLLLRSLQIIREDEDDEVVFSADDPNATDQNEERHIEKGIIADEIAPTEESKEKNVEFDMVQEDEESPVAPPPVEDVEKDVESPLLSKTDLDLSFEADDEGPRKSNYEEEMIETHYKGNIGEGYVEEDEGGELEGKMDPHIELDDGVIMAESSKEIELDLEDEGPKINLNNDEAIEEEDDSPQMKIELDLDQDELPEIKEKFKEDLTAHMTGKTNGNDAVLDLDDGPEIKMEAPPEAEELSSEPLEKIELDLEDLAEDFVDEKEELPEDEEEEKDPHEGKVDHIETHYKGKDSTTDFEEEDGNDVSEGKVDHIEKYYDNMQKEKSIELEITEHESPFKKKKEKEQQLEEHDLGLKEKLNLDLEEHSEIYGPKIKKKELELEEAENYNLSIKKEEQDDIETDDDGPMDLELDLEDGALDLDDDAINELEEEQEEEELELNSAELQLDDDQGALKGKGQATEEADDIMRTKSSGNATLNLKEKKKKKLGDSKVDHISTYYGRKQREQEFQEWEDVEDDAVIEMEFEKIKKRKERVLSVDKKELGEQTINYQQLQKDFEIIGSYKNKAKKVREEEQKETSTEGNEKLPATKKKHNSFEFVADLTEDEEGELEEGEEDLSDVIEPNTKGIEYAIMTYNLYMQQDIKDQEIYKFLTESLHKSVDGLTSFFLYDQKLSAFVPQYIGAERLADVIDRDEMLENWTELQKERLGAWKEMSLPTWSDETFEEENIEFFYPFFEGVTNMGFAITYFRNGIAQEKTSEVETILESARALYVTNFHQSGGDAQYASETMESSDKGEKKKGLLGSVFKRKKAG